MIIGIINFLVEEEGYGTTEAKMGGKEKEGGRMRWRESDEKRFEEFLGLCITTQILKVGRLRGT